MASRAIQGVGTIFDWLYAVPTMSFYLPADSCVVFPSILTDAYRPHEDDTPDVDINHIIYFTNTHKFRIITTPTTENNFLIIWEVSISTCNGSRLPTFSIVVEYSDGTEFTSLPNSGCRTTDTLYGSSLLSLPTPSAEVGRVDYYLSLVNRSGADCYYSSKSLYLSGIMITSIDS